jgi:hypothetical protein
MTRCAERFWDDEPALCGGVASGMLRWNEMCEVRLHDAGFHSEFEIFRWRRSIFISRTNMNRAVISRGVRRRWNTG